MTVHLYLAPAGAGKTAYVLDLAREAARDLQVEARVCLPTHLQAQAWRRRLALAGGAMGVRVMTFDQLYVACLQAAGESYAELSEPVQYRLIRSILERLPLDYYAALTGLPGFIQVIQDFIGELKAARVLPEDFLQAVSEMGGSPRLVELGRIYEAYQQELQGRNWADRAGMGWLAVETLEHQPEVAGDWPLLIADGFDNLTAVQLALLKSLSARVGTMIVTLSGQADGGNGRSVHQRFERTRQLLEGELDVAAEPLPAIGRPNARPLAHLEAKLFVEPAEQLAAENALQLVEAPDRAAEVRVALRWLKEMLVREGLRPVEVALLARNLPPYRPFIVETAAEFGLPIRLHDGLPLGSNPAVAALLNLLRLVLPGPGGGFDLALPRRGVVEAWRSPYFDWANALPAEGETEPIGITPADADALDAAARWGRVIGGLAQWQELLDSLTGRQAGEPADEEQQAPVNVVAGAEAEALEARFTRFLVRLMPPQGQQRYRDFVAWLEDLIGPDPFSLSLADQRAEPAALNVVARARSAGEPLANLDVAALRHLKDILRGLVWAEEGLGDRQAGTAGQSAAFQPVDFAHFFADLAGAVEAATYQPPVDPGREEILVADVIQARGLPLRAVAVMGLAEGEFPATLVEDPLLRETDRDWLRQEAGLALESSIVSDEREFFYETVTRPWERLLLTRPRLADNGAEWLASPFWEEVRRLVAVEPSVLTTDNVPSPERAASPAELMESLVTFPDRQAARAWVLANQEGRWDALLDAGHVFGQRYEAARTPFDGDLTAHSADFGRHFGPGYGWSPSGLETYRTCAFFFYISRVLHLEPRLEPAEGLDVAQLGTLYHQIFETLYASLEPAGRLEPDRLLAALPDVARPILDQAPRRQGFRETAWWQQTRQEMLRNVERSVVGLAEVQDEYVPIRFEARFLGPAALTVADGQDSFRLHGLIDRVDRSPDGRLRLIDYKTGSPYGYSKRLFEQGKRLQLPLYALAARDALGLGQPADGFYWHIRQAQTSDLRLEEYGVEEAIDKAVSFAWEAVRGARSGGFVPKAPPDGCPAYCPAAAFCWQYRPGAWG